MPWKRAAISRSGVVFLLPFPIYLYVVHSSVGAVRGALSIGIRPREHEAAHAVPDVIRRAVAGTEIVPSEAAVYREYDEAAG